MKPTIITPDGQRIVFPEDNLHDLIALQVLSGWRVYVNFKTGEIRQLWHQRVHNPSKRVRDEN